MSVKWEELPTEIQDKMLAYQIAQGNNKNEEIFKNTLGEGGPYGGFDWSKTEEGFSFWYKLLNSGDFNIFFEKYPKQQELADFDNLCSVKPVRCWVWMEGQSKQVRNVVAKLEYGYVTCNGLCQVSVWDYAEPYIQKTVELTKAQICEKFNVTDFKIIE